MVPPICGVIFDMDGVLCDSEPFICEAACRMFRERHGATVQPADFVPFVGTGENRYLGGVAETYGIALDLDRDKAHTYAIYAEIIRGRLHPLSGVHDFVRLCRNRGVKQAVATSADLVKLTANLGQIGLPPSSFDACVNGLDVERRKPAPDLFLLAAARLDLAPADCLVVEDAPSGVQAARAAGMRCLGLTTSFPARALRAHGANWTARDLAHVPNAVLASLTAAHFA